MLPEFSIFVLEQKKEAPRGAGNKKRPGLKTRSFLFKIIAQILISQPVPGIKNKKVNCF